MTFSAWVRLLARNHFKVAPHRIPMVFTVGGAGLCVNDVLWAVQEVVLGRKIRRTEIKDQPIFILGHWRTGTTLLHEFLVCDERHTYPTSYQCFAPSHFIISQSWLGPVIGLLAPSRRPQDDMPFGLDRPQEDEFALANLGLPSPYLTIAFPNHPPQCQQYVDMEGIAAEELDRWKRKFLWFLQCITLKTPKRIVLKSPLHLGRVRVLLEMFPGARFVHIHRDPYAVFPSTLNLWRRFYRYHGLQKPKYEGLEEHVLETFGRLYRAFERDRELIDPSRFCELGYEALVADPVGEVRRIYERLDLGEFDKVRPALEEYLATQADYRPNRYEISLETRDAISRRWGFFIQKYGYSPWSTEA